MRLLPVLVLLSVAPDGGVSHEYLRKVVLAEAACMDADGGLPAVRVDDCIVTCVGEDAQARLVDGGACLARRSGGTRPERRLLGAG